MQATKQYRWLKKEDFQRQNPLFLAIIDVVKNPDKENDVLLQCKQESGDLLQFSIWGTPWNYLIDQLGGDTEQWKGRKFRLMQSSNDKGEVKRSVEI